MDINTILWMFMLGICAAIVSVYYNNRFLGRIIRKLIEIDATNAESALSPKELGVKITPFVKYALRPGTSFSQTVLTTEDGKYYIADNKVDMAKAKYSGKDSSLLFVIISILLLLLVTFALTTVFPDIVDSFVATLSEIFGGRD
ncbi:MAG: hypothetical protein E7586_02270 [Ruminococcaceae bacterium]|nr:hypothetical protein [Oscillospiraceae bacterium]